MRPKNTSFVVTGYVLLIGCLLAAGFFLPRWAIPFLVFAGIASGLMLERDFPVIIHRDSVQEFLSTSMRTPYLIAAMIVGLGATGLLFWPSQDTAPLTGSTPVGPDPNQIEVTQTLPVQEFQLNQMFTIDQLSFLITPASNQLWAQQISDTHPGKNKRWILLEVSVTNNSKQRSNPSSLSYRLVSTNGSGLGFLPAYSGATGPPSLGAQGYLSKGSTALVQLGFAIPISQKSLNLVFEPTANSSNQIIIPIAR